MAEAGSSPTSTVASPGERPKRSSNTATWPATSPRTRAAIALPSMIVAVTGQMLSPRGPEETAAGSGAADRGVVGHQLALGAVAGEAHHDHAARLDPGDDPLAEGRMDYVLAEPELRRPRRRGGLVLPTAAPGSALRRSHRGTHRAPGTSRGHPGGDEARAKDARGRLVHKLRRDLVEKAAGHPVGLGAEH